MSNETCEDYEQNLEQKNKYIDKMKQSLYIIQENNNIGLGFICYIILPEKNLELYALVANINLINNKDLKNDIIF